MSRLPGALHTAMERGSGWSWNLLAMLASDTEQPLEVRVDAAEWLTADLDKPGPIGEEVLLGVLEDGLADPQVRARAFCWLEGNDDTDDAVEELLRRPDRAAGQRIAHDSEDTVADYLAAFRIVLSDAIVGYQGRQGRT